MAIRDGIVDLDFVSQNLTDVMVCHIVQIFLMNKTVLIAKNFGVEMDHVFHIGRHAMEWQIVEIVQMKICQIVNVIFQNDTFFSLILLILHFR